MVKLGVVQVAGLRVAQEVGLRVACWATEEEELVSVPVEVSSECPEPCCLRCPTRSVLEARSVSEPERRPAEAAMTTRPRLLLPAHSSKPSTIR